MFVRRRRSNKCPDLSQLPAISRRIRPTETAGHLSSESSRNTSRPPSPDGSWAGTMITGPATPWSAPWPNWQSEIPNSSTRLLLCSPFYQAAALNLFSLSLHLSHLSHVSKPRNLLRESRTTGAFLVLPVNPVSHRQIPNIRIPLLFF